MTQGQLEGIPVQIVQVFSQLENRIMSDIVRRIKINGFSTASADWQMTRLQQLGMSEKDIKEWIRLALETTEEEMEKIFSDEVYKQYMKHERAYKVNGMQQIPFAENEELQSLLESVRQQTKNTYKNITGSMGFVKQDAAGRLKAIDLKEYYKTTLDAAMLDIHSGAFDYQTVLTRTINEMTKSGVRWIDYGSGRRDRIDVAARRSIMTGFRQVQGKINEQTAAQLGTDTYEVTYHVGARPDHQPWQGKVWTMQQLKEICGLGTALGLHGINCYHDYKAFIPGISVRTYTDEQLQRMNKAENTLKNYNGRQYTTYEALQQQRKMERNMRKTRQDIKLMEEGEADEQSILLKKGRYYGQMQAYVDFSEKMKLPQQRDRIYQDGLKGNFSSKAAYDRVQQKESKDIEKVTATGIIKTGTTKEVADVHAVGKIDREIYKCVTEDIATDEVIITDNQIQHIKDRHPNDYERFSSYFAEILAEPDYILEANKPNTAFVLKRIQKDGVNFQLILRLQTSQDPKGYKNSIITFLKIEQRKWDKYLRNKKVLYRRE